MANIFLKLGLASSESDNRRVLAVLHNLQAYNAPNLIPWGSVQLVIDRANFGSPGAHPLKLAAADVQGPTRVERRR